MEKQKPFHGWTVVFRFTVLQTLKTTKIRLVTLLLGIVLFIGASVLNIIISLSQGPSPIRNIYVVNTSDLTGNFQELAQSEKYGHVQIHMETKEREELLEELAGTDYDLAVFLSMEEDEYHIETVLPLGTNLTRGDGQELGEQLKEYVEMYKLRKAEVDPAIYEIVSAKGMSQVIAAGRSAKGEGELLMQILLPLIIGSVLFAMIMLYAQTIAKTIVAEKSSKLMETLLTCIRPYALVAGKIASMAVIALAQLGIWLLCALLGLWTGDFIGHILNPNYVNGMMLALEHLKENGGLTALSPEGLLLSLIALCLGFFMYCVIAGFLNSFASKPEDLSNTMGVFFTITIISWLAAYVLPLYAIMRGAAISGILNYIPFTAAFCLPADILVGNMKLMGTCLALAIMIATTLIFIFLTGKIYRDKVFYRGVSPFGIIRKNH